jgi:alpha-glucosidase
MRGRLAYEIQRHGKQLIAPSRLGFLLANAPQLDNGFTLDKQAVTEHDDTWEQPWGERRYVRNHYKELRLELVQKAARTAAWRWCSACSTMASASATRFRISRN